MKPQRMAAAALSFAHLIGLKRAEEDEDKKARRAEEGDEDPDKKDAARADEEDGDGDENMQSNRAEEGDEEEGDDDEQEGKKGRKAKSRAEGSDEEDGEEEDDDKKSKASAVRLAVRRERARCAQIIAHGIATGRVRQAGVLAFDSELSVKAAKTMLDAGGADQPAPKRESLIERMSSQNIVTVGADAEDNAPAGMTKAAAAIIAAGAKARGEPVKK